jgi:hypothetical protein
MSIAFFDSKGPVADVARTTRDARLSPSPFQGGSRGGNVELAEV